MDMAVTVDLADHCDTVEDWDHKLLGRIRAMREEHRFGGARKLSFDSEEAEHKREVEWQRFHDEKLLPRKVFFSGSFRSEESSGRLEA
jgi:hypothetical protein